MNTQEVTATVCHLHECPLHAGDQVLIKHGTRSVKAIIKELSHRVDLTQELALQDNPGELTANDIGAIRLRTAEPLPLDAYAESRLTGCFLLLSPVDGTTLTAGMCT
ncbi:hypothetical protein BX257_7141 [Streptomyces sp. 3212.3]|nr:hypothetical protein BX257_7141 [Streptomyces sp. 3212.3]